MTITPEMETMFKGDPFFLELEMLQGEKKILEDGMISYRITIADPDKAELVKEFALKCISLSHTNINN